MERYEQHRTASISRIIPVYDRGRAVQADQEDGTAKISIGPGFLFMELGRAHNPKGGFSLYIWRSLIY